MRERGGEGGMGEEVSVLTILWLEITECIVVVVQVLEGKDDGGHVKLTGEGRGSGSDREG